MTQPTPVVFVHGFIGTLDVRGWNGPMRFATRSSASCTRRPPDNP